MQDWLTHPVPLWAFLVALLTRPADWSNWAKERLTERFGTDGGS